MDWDGLGAIALGAISLGFILGFFVCLFFAGAMMLEVRSEHCAKKGGVYIDGKCLDVKEF